MKILSFGEILWDVFGETKTLGGAPLNFASHCARLGAECLMISAVGSDENGAEALALARENGVNTEYVAGIRPAYAMSRSQTGFRSTSL